MKKVIQVILFVVSVSAHVIGLLGLCYINQWISSPMYAFLDGLALIWKYVICAVTVAVGIILFTAFAMTLNGKLKNILSIGVTTWSTILTIPLFLTFVLSFVVASGTEVPLVSDITHGIQEVFKPEWLQYVIYAGGTVLGIVCLAVPIVTTVSTVKKNR